MVLQHSPCLLTDAPLSADDLRSADKARLQPLIDTLCELLAPSLRPGNSNLEYKAPPAAAPRIGLFGGLGQGKSTVVAEVLRELASRRSGWQRWRDALLGSRVALFDTSHYRATDLEWRFFDALLASRIRRNLWPAAGAAMLVVAVFSVNWLVNKDWTWAGLIAQHWQLALNWLLAAAGVLLLVWQPAALMASKVAQSLNAGRAAADAALPGAGLSYTAKDLRARRWARLSLSMPQVVVVDDLDRASLDQQRAVLRASRRYSQLLGCALVICMDETALLNADAAPEAPEELLRKVIEVELRVPDRGPEDWVVLAATTARWVGLRNPALDTLMRQPALVADLARVLALWPTPVSPRLVKRLLNDTLVQVFELGAVRLNLVSACLRLQALVQALPGLRQRMDGLRDALEHNSMARFSQLLGTLEPAPPAARRDATIRLFSMTRAMQPRHGHGWYQILTSLRFDGTGLGEENSDPCWTSAPPSLVLSTEGKDGWSAARLLHLMAEVIELRQAVGMGGFYHWVARDGGTQGDPPAEHDGSVTLHGCRDVALSARHASLPQAWMTDIDGVTGRSGRAEFIALGWALWQTFLARLDAPQRLVAYVNLQDWLEEAPKLPGWDPELKRTLEWCSLREQAADHEAWQCMTPHQRLALNLRLQPDKTSGSGLSWLIALTSDDLPLALQSLQRGNGPQGLDELARVRWLKPVQNPRPPLPLSSDARSVALPPDAVLADTLAWPMVWPDTADGAGWFDVLSRHLAHWTDLHAIGSAALAASLKHAWRQASSHLDANQQLQLLTQVMCGDRGASPLHLERLAMFLTEVQASGAAPGTVHFCGLAGLWPSLCWQSQLVALWCDLFNQFDLKPHHVDALSPLARYQLAKLMPLWLRTKTCETVLSRPRLGQDTLLLLLRLSIRPPGAQEVGLNWTDDLQRLLNARSDRITLIEQLGLPLQPDL